MTNAVNVYFDCATYDPYCNTAFPYCAGAPHLQNYRNGTWESDGAWYAGCGGNYSAKQYSTASGDTHFRIAWNNGATLSSSLAVGDGDIVRIYYDSSIGYLLEIEGVQMPTTWGAAFNLTNEWGSGMLVSLVTNGVEVSAVWVGSMEAWTNYLSLTDTNDVVQIVSRVYDEFGNLTTNRVQLISGSSFGSNSVASLTGGLGPTNRGLSFPSGPGYGTTNPAADGTVQTGLSGVKQAVEGLRDANNSANAGLSSNLVAGLDQIHRDLTNILGADSNRVDAGRALSQTNSSAVASGAAGISNSVGAWISGWVPGGTNIGGASNPDVWKFSAGGVEVDWSPWRQTWFSGLVGVWQKLLEWALWLFYGVAVMKMVSTEMRWLQATPQSTASVPLAAVALAIIVAAIVAGAGTVIFSYAVKPLAWGVNPFTWAMGALSGESWAIEAGVLLDAFMPWAPIVTILGGLVTTWGVIAATSAGAKAFIRGAAA